MRGHHPTRLSETDEKVVYNQNLCQLLGKNDQILIIATVDVGYNRLLDICKVYAEIPLF